MASLPQKSTSGNNLKQWLIRSIEGLIDYLSATRVRPGYGISVEETPSGTVISLKNRPAAAPVSLSGGTTSTADIEGGTGILVTGSTTKTISANIEGGTDIEITGGTGGDPLVVSYTGSGGGGGGGLCFPDYSALSVSSASGTVLSNGVDFTATSAGWLRVSIRNDGGLSDGCFRLVINGTDIGFYQYRTGSPGITKFVYIPSGAVVRYSTSSSSSFVKFAPGIGSGMPAPIYSAMAGSGGSPLSANETYTLPEDGWVRISIRNDSNLSDGCFRLIIDGGSIGFYQYRTGSCGITDFIPVQGGKTFRFETSSTTYYVKYDHVYS